jgi:NAD(P) transhydrogenase
MREAILHLTGLRQRGFYGQGYRVKQEMTFEDISARTKIVIDREQAVLADQLARNHVALVQGRATIVDPNTVRVTAENGDERLLTTKSIVIATGSSPAHPADVEFDGAIVLDSDQILDLDRIPDTLLVVGAGVIGIEYCSMFAALGSTVTIVESRPAMLEFCDLEIVEALRYHLRDLGVTFRFGETVAAVENVYAVGDVIGFPSLASVSAEQGRLAACAASGEPAHALSELLPFGIYTIPEVSFVGKTEAELTEDGVPFEVGVARYRELARGVILGETYGLLKLVVSADDGRILAVHAFGTGAAELIHIGQAAMGLGGTVDYFVDSVFNYPTLAEAYKIAALNAANKLRAISV